MKALGQAGLDFIANKYKELKELIGGKADKSEIITKEERHQLEVARERLVSTTIRDFESKLKNCSDYVLRYPKTSYIKMFSFVDEVKKGNITPPQGINTPYIYSMQKWFLDNKDFQPYALRNSQMHTFSLEQISAFAQDDRTVCLIHKSVMDAVDTYFSANRALMTTTDYFVKQEDGKSLSTNDYDNTAKSKVDAIPANPKYTDTTYDLSKYAEKADISRCKTKGYDTSSTWLSLSTSRDLEDWIGDFDKRTRELKESAGGEVEQYSPSVSVRSGEGSVTLYKWGHIVFVQADGRSSDGSVGLLYEVTIPEHFRPSAMVSVEGHNCSFDIGKRGMLEFTATSSGVWGYGSLAYITTN